MTRINLVFFPYELNRVTFLLIVTQRTISFEEKIDVFIVPLNITTATCASNNKQ
jgi:hypothetical protein